MENLLTALSNITAYYPILHALRAGDYLTAGCIGYVGVASFLSHLVENHKHGMPGIGFSRQVSYFLNRLDVLGCFLVAGRFGYLYYNTFGITLRPFIMHPGMTLCLLGSLALNKLSESDKTPETKSFYLLTHNVWHLSIFIIMDYFYGLF